MVPSVETKTVLAVGESNNFLGLILYLMFSVREDVYMHLPFCGVIVTTVTFMLVCLVI